MPIELGSFSLGSVAGGIVGAIAGHYLTKSRNTEDRKIKEFNDASANFRDAFKSELLSLNTALTKDYIDACDLLQAAFEKHRLAVFDFRLFLRGNRQEEFDQAWRDYYGYDGDQKVKLEFLLKYSGKGYGGEEARSRRAAAIANIEKLLEFAGHK
jgi:hypothetical protein